MAKKNKKGSNKPGMKSNSLPDAQKTNVIANDYVEDVPTIVNTKIELAFPHFSYQPDFHLPWFGQIGSIW